MLPAMVTLVGDLALLTSQQHLQLQQQLGDDDDAGFDHELLVVRAVTDMCVQVSDDRRPSVFAVAGSSMRCSPSGRFLPHARSLGSLSLPPWC